MTPVLVLPSSLGTTVALTEAAHLANVERPEAFSTLVADHLARVEVE